MLSACETGLGLVGGGEGVFGLQRAFHLAGAHNVVASLWKVDDQATAALMALFYDRLWQQGKPPLEALREAQLALYRQPELVGKLAAARGTSDFDKLVRGRRTSTSWCSVPSRGRVRTARRHRIAPRCGSGRRLCFRGTEDEKVVQNCAGGSV